MGQVSRYWAKVSPPLNAAGALAAQKRMGVGEERGDFEREERREQRGCACPKERKGKIQAYYGLNAFKFIAP